MNIKIRPFIEETDFWAAALKATLKSIEEALEKHGHARIGLAGGSTPKKLYELISRQDLPWRQITWILLDERYVPVDAEESNLGMIENALFRPASVSEENRVFFDTSLTAVESSDSMNKKLLFLEKIREPLFDLLILGAGKDGHIASLFEGDTSLLTPHYAYVCTAPVGYETTQRLTVSLSALCKATHALLLLKGEEKRPVVEALEGEPILKITALKKLINKVPTEVVVNF